MTRKRMLLLMDLYGIKMPTLNITITDDHKKQLQDVQRKIMYSGSFFICDYLEKNSDLYKAIGQCLADHGAFTIFGYFSKQLLKNNRVLPEDSLTKRNVRILWLDFLCGALNV